MRKILPIIALILFSCSNAKHYQKIHGLSRSGTYTIKSIEAHTATFKEFPGRYEVPSDTLKIGDKIFISVIKKNN